MNVKIRLTSAALSLALLGGGAVALAPSASATTETSGGDVNLLVRSVGHYVYYAEVSSNRHIKSGYRGHYELYGSWSGNSTETNIKAPIFNGGVATWQINRTVTPGHICARVWEHVKDRYGNVVSYKLRGDTCNKV